MVHGVWVVLEVTVLGKYPADGIEPGDVTDGVVAEYAEST